MSVLGTEVSSEGGVASETVEWPRRGERLQKRLNVLRRRSSLEKALDLSRLHEDARTFFLGLQWTCQYVEFVACLCCAQDNNLSEESTDQAETDAAGDVLNTTRTEKQRKAINTVFNEVR